MYGTLYVQYGTLYEQYGTLYVQYCTLYMYSMNPPSSLDCRAYRPGGVSVRVRGPRTPGAQKK